MGRRRRRRPAPTGREEGNCDVERDNTAEHNHDDRRLPLDGCLVHPCPRGLRGWGAQRSRRPVAFGRPPRRGRGGRYGRQRHARQVVAPPRWPRLAAARMRLRKCWPAQRHRDRPAPGLPRPWGQAKPISIGSFSSSGAVGSSVRGCAMAGCGASSGRGATPASRSISCGPSGCACSVIASSAGGVRVKKSSKFGSGANSGSGASSAAE